MATKKIEATETTKVADGTYRVLTPLRVGLGRDADGKRVSLTYAVGELAQMDDDTAARLLAERAIERVEADAKSEDKAPE